MHLRYKDNSLLDLPSCNDHKPAWLDRIEAFYVYNRSMIGLYAVASVRCLPPFQESVDGLRRSNLVAMDLEACWTASEQPAAPEILSDLPLSMLPSVPAQIIMQEPPVCRGHRKGRLLVGKE